MIVTDIGIIGAGPVGLFAVFEAGLLKLRCHVMDALPQIGGQLYEIYPKKPIYDIPGMPIVMAQELVDNLKKQIEPFKPTFTLGEKVDGLKQNADGSFLISTSENTSVHCKVVVIAAGLGCFEPRKPDIENRELFEGSGLVYMIKDPETFRGKKVVIAGGGDSALDWTAYLTSIAERVTLVHRSESFRGAPDTLQKVLDLSKAGKIDLLLSSTLKGVHGNGELKSVSVLDKENKMQEIEADYLVPLFGLSPKLGPIADWGIHLEKNTIPVNTVDYSTSVPGIFAIGDINTYPGKLKLILCGFHEAAVMMHRAFAIVHPDQKISFKYTTVNGINPF